MTTSDKQKRVFCFSMSTAGNFERCSGRPVSPADKSRSGHRAAVIIASVTRTGHDRRLLCIVIKRYCCSDVPVTRRRRRRRRRRSCSARNDDDCAADSDRVKNGRLLRVLSRTIDLCVILFYQGGRRRVRAPRHETESERDGDGANHWRTRRARVTRKRCAES